MMSRMVWCLFFTLLSAGCSREDKDVSSLAHYKFSTFSGTTWRTKVKMVIAEMNDYKGATEQTLLPPRWFDSKHPDYDSKLHPKVIICELPAGTSLQIARLVKDNGSWGGLKVIVRIDDGRHVILNRWLLASNKFLYIGQSETDEWGMAAELMERQTK